ncbi:MULTISPECIES: hypothetical protein [unclassified Streptomyces]|uniref:hypothetical protein n=1 Tax=unclassified Streptomyces TaxID=2593676 RepID=UPI0035DC803F
MPHRDSTLIDPDKSPLADLDEEALRLADVLAAHPDVTNSTGLADGADVVFTTARGTWLLTFQEEADRRVIREPSDAPAPASGRTLSVDVVTDVIAPALLAHPAYQTVTDASVGGLFIAIHLTGGRHYTLSVRPRPETREDSR